MAIQRITISSQENPDADLLGYEIHNLTCPDDRNLQATHLVYIHESRTVYIGTGSTGELELTVE